MGQPGSFHDVGNADPVETMLAQQARRSLDDLLAVLQRLFARHPHRFLTPLVAGPASAGLGHGRAISDSQKLRLTFFMTIII
ncbi:hypothetical protein [Bradyrhizobium sp. AUGA SZCCT0431]|uniref:hypothetical protein n=1 Tax=Bradyrhizobium sp. AUGA SZCCT0431 TaxID=2807674 RepID=UPI003908A84C